jgi:UDP-N-acetylglucosamine enolpyruvyl transferase
LCAEGESVLHHAWHVDRGYENMPGKLAAVGAQIVSETVEPDADTSAHTYE